MHIDSFSGAVSELKRGDRTSENVLSALRRDPRVSCWDMSEHYKWLPSIIADLKKSGAIVELDEPYPWLRFRVLPVGVPRAPVTEGLKGHAATKASLLPPLTEPRED